MFIAVCIFHKLLNWRDDPDPDLLYWLVEDLFQHMPYGKKKTVHSNKTFDNDNTQVTQMDMFDAILTPSQPEKFLVHKIENGRYSYITTTNAECINKFSDGKRMDF